MHSFPIVIYKHFTKQLTIEREKMTAIVLFQFVHDVACLQTGLFLAFLFGGK